MAMVAVATFMILELKDIDVNQCINKNEKHIHPHLCVIHSFRLSLECFDADRRSLEGKKLNENSHRSPSFYTHTMSFKDFFLGISDEFQTFLMILIDCFFFRDF